MSDRKEKILDVAERLVQERGFNGFSYVDLSEEIGIKTSSIHYYFKTKDALGVFLIRRYATNLKTQLDTIDSDTSDPKEKLIKYSEIFQGLARTNTKFCLCGMMAAELSALSKNARKELSQYFEMNKKWLSAVFTNLGSPMPDIDSESYLSLLEGTLLIARVNQEPAMVTRVAESFLKKGNKKGEFHE